jgi:hypothetical protein
MATLIQAVFTLVAVAVISTGWKSQNRVFGDLAAVVDIFATTLTGSGEPEELLAGAVKANFFQRIGVRPVVAARL